MKKYTITLSRPEAEEMILFFGNALEYSNYFPKLAAFFMFQELKHKLEGELLYNNEKPKLRLTSVYAVILYYVCATLEDYPATDYGLLTLQKVSLEIHQKVIGQNETR